MIPPVDSYTPAAANVTSSVLETTDQHATAIGAQSSPAQMSIDPTFTRALPQPDKTFSLAELNQLIKNITKMIREFSKLWNRQGGGDAPTTTQPVLSNNQTPSSTAISPQRTPSESWLTPIDQEAETIIPDIEGPSDTVTTPIEPAPGTPTAPSTSPNTGGMGIGTLTSDDPEVIPDLDPDLPPPPTTGAKEYSIGTTLSRSGQFLWKPVADKDGKLAILLPSRLTGKIKSVAILSPDKTKIIAKGKYSGVGNGDREHFRFSKAGGAYPDNAIVMITLKDGKTYNVKVKETSDRYER
jgi:hypothetical protein